MVNKFFPIDEQILLYFFYCFILNINCFSQLVLYAAFQFLHTVGLENEDATTQEVNRVVCIPYVTEECYA